MCVKDNYGGSKLLGCIIDNRRTNNFIRAHGIQLLRINKNLAYLYIEYLIMG